ncbi:MAG: TIGR04282 family arsenosugar biosynthesis glycosyltransferase [Bacteroidota bacterium]
MNNLLLIFVKHPEAGKSKTRLAATLGHDKALDIYRRLLAYTRDISAQVDADKAVFYGNQMPKKDLWSDINYPRYQQEGEGLGERMEHAFKWGFEQGYKRIVIIGSDNARLTASHLQEGFDSLGEKDFVIGPAKDGGYYLLGMKELFADVFSNKEWSTATVFSDTKEDIVKVGKSLAELETLSDVDVEADLKGTFLEEFTTEKESGA